MLVLIKIIGLVVVVVCGFAALLYKKAAPHILKREISDDEALKFKTVMLALVCIGALAVVLSDYINF